jgi:hypothetical protein
VKLLSGKQGTMKPLKALSTFTLLFLASTAYAQKHPEIFDVSDVVIGAQRLPTRYLYAAGAWSDASEMEMLCRYRSSATNRSISAMWREQLLLDKDQEV